MKLRFATKGRQDREAALADDFLKAEHEVAELQTLPLQQLVDLDSTAQES